MVILASAVLGWLIFVTGIFVDIVTDTSYSTDELYGPDAAAILRPSRYLFFAAIAVFISGGLWAIKRIEALGSSQDSPSSLVKPAHDFSGTAIIIGIIFAAIGAISVFLDSFFGSGSAEIPVGVRLWNTYLPIVLYTALVVSALLVAFVFRKHRLISAPVTEKSPSTIDADTEGTALIQRSVGLGFSLPIVAVAIGLIVGLIVYDVTQTAIQVWIWVLIQALIAAGIIAGAWFAQRATRELRTEHRQVGGAVVGAKNLNFVLSIVFAAIVAAMSLGYGSSAMEQLRISPSLTLSVYEQEPKEPTESGDEFAIESTKVMVNGSDLKRRSQVTLTLVPSGDELFVSQADREGYFWEEADFPADVTPGSYTLEVTALSADDAELTRSVPVVVSESDTVTLPEGDAGFDESNWQPRLMGISLTWVLSDLVPAFLLLVLSAGSIALTLRIRNPEEA